MDRRQFTKLAAASAVLAGTGVTSARAAGPGRTSTYVPSTTSPVGPIYRTPESSFADLSGYPFPPQYVRVAPGGLRMHYLDEGPRDADVVLLTHGNPSWSYIYREWIPRLVDAGYRVVAPDLIGFGRSDKLGREDYSYGRQVAWAAGLVAALGLHRVTLYCQDWGGLIYLQVVAQQPWRFDRVVVSNTALPDSDDDFAEPFRRWQTDISQNTPAFAPIMDDAVVRPLSSSELAAYDAPWPTEILKSAAREMPQEVPTTGSGSAAVNLAVQDFFRHWRRPLLSLWSENETQVLTGIWGTGAFFRDQVPGAVGMPHRVYPPDLAGHYIQEDLPQELTTRMLEFLDLTS